MKKITFMAAMAIAAAVVTSCGQSPAKANLKTDIDSASYASGVQQAERFNQANVLEQMEVDSAYLNDFVKGLNDAVSASYSKKKLAYFMGANVGVQIAKGIQSSAIVKCQRAMNNNLCTENTFKMYSTTRPASFPSKANAFFQ